MIDIHASATDEDAKTEEVKSNSLNIERNVPVSEAEILGVGIRKNRKGVVLEIGYYKDKDKDIIVIDTRKLINLKMAKNLYSKLKVLFDDEDSKAKE